MPHETHHGRHDQQGNVRLPSTTSSSGPMTEDYVISRVQVPKSEYCPHLTLVVAPCRSGTTALFVALSKLQPAYYQHLKSILRTGKGELQVPVEQSSLAMKETLGPFNKSEASFDPLRIMLRAGFPAEKISLITMFREPSDCYASWCDNFEGTSRELFLASYRAAAKITNYARQSSINSTVFIYESLSVNKDEVIQRLFERSGNRFSPQVTDWSQGDNTQIIMDPNPGYETEEQQRNFEDIIFGRVLNQGGISFIKRTQTNQGNIHSLEEAMNIYSEMQRLHRGNNPPAERGALKQGPLEGAIPPKGG